MPDTIQILTTTPDKDLAQRIAHALVEARLAACVQISGPVESIYRWEDRVESAAEWQCWIKTTRDRYAEVEQAIRGLHPYEVPEILALPVVEGQVDYLQWLTQSLVRDTPLS
jgi:periplasmic divalent cation tolerance protein